MKKNAVGLANICIMSTAVLVMISTTISMYVGMNDVMKHRFPKDVQISTRYAPEARVDGDKIQNTIKNLLDKDKIAYSDFSGYESLNFATVRNGNTYRAKEYNNFVGNEDTSVLIFITEDNFSKFSGEKYQLADNEVVLVSDRQVNKVNMLGHEFNVKKVLNESPISDFNTWLSDVVYVVVDSPEVIDEMYYKQRDVYADDACKICYDTTFDFDMEDEEVINYCNNNFVNSIENQPTDFRYDIRQLNIEQFYILYGGLFFLGIFLGFLFLMATILIIYYKQVVEGYEDRERFKIMQKVGMSKHEIKKAINSQVLTVFALPILAAVIHIAAAFRILKMMLSMLNLTNVPLFAICTVITIVVFAIFYAIVYFATSKVYYKIINQDTN